MSGSRMEKVGLAGFGGQGGTQSAADLMHIAVTVVGVEEANCRGALDSGDLLDPELRKTIPAMEACQVGRKVSEVR